MGSRLPSKNDDVLTAPTKIDKRISWFGHLFATLLKTEFPRRFS